ncbi:MAG: Ig-like domain-containing protein [Rhodothermales bacterium]
MMPRLLPTSPLMVRLLPLLVLAVSLAAPASAQVTGLSDWSLYLDPGHSQNENIGVFGYSEARKVLRVGLELRDILLTETDIDTVYLSRTNDQQNVGLSQRVDDANALNADHFHSIHSNAAAPSANSLFVLWPQLRTGGEPAPPYNGGRPWAEIMGPLLGRGMRIPLSNDGAWGECDFYGESSCRDVSVTPKGSRNFVQSFSLMPSALSEAGFHTNPTQNQRNMNAEWKQLEARAMFWAILDYHGIERPPARIATGIVSDLESEQPINGAVITIGGQSYTTDTYESLFNQYSDDPDELRNGFYYLPGLPAGTLAFTVEAEGYAPFSSQITPVDTFFTFTDVQLVSTIPPVVTSTTPAEGDDNFRITDPLVFEFSRPMDRASVEAAFSIAPDVDGTFAWNEADTRLVFEPDTLLPQTDYTVTIAGTAEGAFEDPLDGDGDGTGGDAFTLTFTTGFPDTVPPRLAGAFPAFGATGVEFRPLVTATFSERINPATLDGRVRLEPTGGGAAVPGEVVPYDVGEQSVVTFFPAADLAAETVYRLVLEAGIEDLFRNAQPSRQQTLFTTGSRATVVTEIDDFESDVDVNWWVPQQSGSTTGIVTDSTGAVVDTDVYNLLNGGVASFRLDYGWNVDTSPWLIREFLAGGPPFNVRFDSTYTLQAYVFGDGLGNQFRFAVDDRVNTGTTGTEVSPWFTIDWVGWQLVSWNMGSDGVGSWIGDGVLDGTLRFDSMQLTYVPGNEPFGQYYIDDLRLVKQMAVAGEPEAGTPERFRVHASYPNPFRTETTIAFDLPATAEVTAVVYNVRGAEVARLADGARFPAGTNALTWDASALASGVYFCRLTAGESTETIKLTLVR